MFLHVRRVFIRRKLTRQDRDVKLIRILIPEGLQDIKREISLLIDELFSETTMRAKGTVCRIADSRVWTSISGRSRVAITRAVVVMILVSCVEVATLCLVQEIP